MNVTFATVIGIIIKKMYDNILECKNITKSFKNNNKLTPILSGVSFCIARSSFTAITGKSGCGKTTLLNILSGISLPDSGEVIINGTNIAGLKEIERCAFRLNNFGMIFQDDNLVDCFNAYQNVILPLMGQKNKIDKEEIEKICENLGIPDLLKRYPGELSGGQKQRVAIARVLAKKPLIIFADEPTGSLDGIAEEEVLDILKKINADFGTTIVVVTHSENCILRADTQIKLSGINK